MHALAHRKRFKIFSHRHYLPNVHLSVYILVAASPFLQEQDLEVRPWFKTQASGQRFPYTISTVQWLTRTSFLQGQQPKFSSSEISYPLSSGYSRIHRKFQTALVRLELQVGPLTSEWAATSCSTGSPC